MKVNDLARSLNISVRELSDFLRTQNFRINTRQNPKLTPQKAQEIKSIYHRIYKKNTEEPEVLETRHVTLNKTKMCLGDLINALDITLNQAMQYVLKSGQLLNINSEIDQAFIADLAKHYNIEVTFPNNTVKEKTDLKDTLLQIEEKEIEDHIDHLKSRAPIVAIMGHVDHGKTLLLDTIRKTNVIGKESGGITQHIGAYQVTKNKQKLTFLDTPGHQAFTSLRARGAQVTDIAILVVAADDGVKPQTKEAIKHAQAAQVPIIVAINKIDQPNIDIDRCKKQLTEYDLVSEDWGGKTVVVPLSAKTGEGIDDLLDMILLTAEMLELKAIHHGPAKGVVVESNLSRQKGAVATILIKTGQLNIGDFFVVHNQVGKIKALFNDQGQKIKTAFPGDPVEILGCSTVPLPGQILEVHANEKACRAHIDQLSIESSADSLSLKDLSTHINTGALTQLNLIIKADVNGSLEAIIAMINQIESINIPLHIVLAQTGNITEADIRLAMASRALILGFCVTSSSDAQKLAQENAISIQLYRIIYELIDDVQAALKGLKKIEFELVETGKAEVRQLYKFSKTGVIAGSYVLSGKIIRSGEIVVLREKKEVYRGQLNSLRRFKDDVSEVVEKYECGIVLEKFNDLKEKDLVICYEKKEKKDN